MPARDGADLEAGASLPVGAPLPAPPSALGGFPGADAAAGGRHTGDREDDWSDPQLTKKSKTPHAAEV